MVEFLYDELLKYDLTYDKMYDMTIYELRKTLEQRAEGLSYRLWKLGNLCQMMEKYPEKPEDANPELVMKQKKSYKMEPWMIEKYIIKRGNKFY